jgi:hypothetical protein
VETIREQLAVAHRPKKVLKLNDLFALKLNLQDSLSLLTSEERSLSYGDTGQAISDIRQPDPRGAEGHREAKKKKTGEKFVLKGRFSSDAEINKIQSDLDSLRSFVAVNNTSDENLALEPQTQLSLDRSETSNANHSEPEGKQADRRREREIGGQAGEERQGTGKDRIYHNNFISDSREQDGLDGRQEGDEEQEEVEECEVARVHQERGAGRRYQPHQQCMAQSQAAVQYCQEDVQAEEYHR